VSAYPIILVIVTVEHLSPSEGLFVKAWSGCLPQHIPSCKGAFDDFSSPTYDRGHAKSPSCEGMSHRKKTSRPDLSSRQAGQCVLAQGGDYDRTSFLSIRRHSKQTACWVLFSNPQISEHSNFTKRNYSGGLRHRTPHPIKTTHQNKQQQRAQGYRNESPNRNLKAPTRQIPWNFQETPH
jgi:hypothetical protein